MKNITFLILVLTLISSLLNAKDSKLVKSVIPESSSVKCISTKLPPITVVHQSALKYARINPIEIDKWKKRAKWAAALPRLQFGYERKLSNGVNVDVDDSVSVTSSGVVVGPSTSAWDRSLDRNHNIEVKLIWYLDELLFNRDTLSISSESRSQISARRNLLGEINEDYYELKRLLSILHSDFKLKEKPAIKLYVDYLAGKLNAATGGHFNALVNIDGIKCDD